MWPAFLVLTLFDGLFLHARPIAGEHTGVVEGLLLGCLLNLVAVAVVAPMVGAVVATLEEAGIGARVRTEEGPDFTGVWVHDRKIASIGIHVARGVSTHGFAINVENDLQPFEWVVPCGLEGVRMTSVIHERGDPAPGAMPAFRAIVARCFAAAFERTPRNIRAEELAAAGVPSS